MRSTVENFLVRQIQLDLLVPQARCKAFKPDILFHSRLDLQSQSTVQLENDKFGVQDIDVYIKLTSSSR